MAQMASCARGTARVQELFGKYGFETMLARIDEMLDATERRIRSRIRSELKEGTYHRRRLARRGRRERHEGEARRHAHGQGRPSHARSVGLLAPDRQRQERAAHAFVRDGVFLPEVDRRSVHPDERRPLSDGVDRRARRPGGESGRARGGELAQHDFHDTRRGADQRAGPGGARAQRRRRRPGAGLHQRRHRSGERTLFHQLRKSRGRAGRALHRRRHGRRDDQHDQHFESADRSDGSRVSAAHRALRARLRFGRRRQVPRRPGRASRHAHAGRQRERLAAQRASSDFLRRGLRARNPAGSARSFAIPARRARPGSG